MSKEVQEKCQQLLCVIALLLGSMCAILVVGVLTRPDVIAVEAPSKILTDGVVIGVCNGYSGLPSEFKIAIEEAKSNPVLLDAEPLTGKALYDSYVDEIVEQYYPDLDPEYIRAIIYYESRYDPNCRNKKTNATGLMQILPKWHTKRARNLGVMDLFDPYGNILVGCDILHEISSKHGFEYALNFYDGGYAYANRYKGRMSPYVKALEKIIAMERSGDLNDVYGGE